MPVAAGTPGLPAHARVTIIGAGIAGLQRRLRLNGARVWHGVGGLEVAWPPQRLVDLKRKVSAGRAWSVECCGCGHWRR